MASLLRPNHQIVLWSLLAGDWRTDFSDEYCARLVLDNLRPGAIIVLHDNPRFGDRLRNILPPILQRIEERGLTSRALG